MRESRRCGSCAASTPHHAFQGPVFFFLAGLEIKIRVNLFCSSICQMKSLLDNYASLRIKWNHFLARCGADVCEWPWVLLYRGLLMVEMSCFIVAAFSVFSFYSCARDE